MSDNSPGPLNLIDMGSARSVRKAMSETIRRTAGNPSANLQAALGNHDFAYAIQRAVADAAEMALQYGLGNGNWQNNPHVNQAVPAGMKFGGWTGTINEVLINDSPNNLQVEGQVNPAGPEPDMNITNKIIGVDNSWLANAWRKFGGNR